MKKKVKYLICGVAGVSVIGGMAIYVMLPESVDIAKAGKQDITEYVNEKGTIAANDTVDIYATVDGKLENVNCEIGDEVSPEDILAEYNLAEYEMAYDKAVANVAYYTDEYSAAVAENDKAKANLNSAQKAASEYQNQYTEIQNNLNFIDVNLALESEIVTEQTKQLEKSAAMIETKLSSAESTKQTLKAETDSLANEIATLKGTVSGCESQIARDNKKIDELKADGGNHDTEISALLAASESAQAQKSAAQAQLDSLHARKDELDSQYASICGTVNSLTSQLNNNRTALSNLPTEGMTGEETLAYLELSKNLNIATINWNESLTQIQAARERMVTTETLEYHMDSVKLAQLEQIASERLLEKAKMGIVSSCDGVILEKYVDDGATVMAGQALYTIQPTTGYKVTVKVSKYDIEKIAMNQEAIITVGDVTYTGKVSKIYKVAETDSSGKAKVKVDIEIADTTSMPTIGLEANIKIITAQKTNTLSVPYNAVYSDDAGDYVYVLESGKAIRKSISLGAEGDELYEVLDGISEGEEVIITPLSDDDVGTRFRAK